MDIEHNPAGKSRGGRPPSETRSENIVGDVSPLRPFGLGMLDVRPDSKGSSPLRAHARKSRRGELPPRDFRVGSHGASLPFEFFGRGSAPYGHGSIPHLGSRAEFPAGRRSGAPEAHSASSDQPAGRQGRLSREALPPFQTRTLLLPAPAGTRKPSSIQGIRAHGRVALGAGRAAVRIDRRTLLGLVTTGTPTVRIDRSSGGEQGEPGGQAGATTRSILQVFVPTETRLALSPARRAAPANQRGGGGSPLQQSGAPCGAGLRGGISPVPTRRCPAGFAAGPASWEALVSVSGRGVERTRAQAAALAGRVAVLARLSCMLKQTTNHLSPLHGAGKPWSLLVGNLSRRSR